MKRTARVMILLMITAILWAALPIWSDSTATQPTRNETVVLLHGLIRSDRSMRKMEQALQADGYRVINHDYPSTSAPIAKLTDDIFKALTPQIKDATKLHFVTHSMGGIILRQHLEHHALPNLGRTVMLAPPSQGSEVPDKLGNNFIYNTLNGPAGNELGTGPNSLPRQLGPPTFELGIIAGDRTVNPILSLLIPGPDDGKVSLARVKPPALTDFILIHATHTFMAKNQEVIAQTKHFLTHGQFKHEKAANSQHPRI